MTELSCKYLPTATIMQQIVVDCCMMGNQLQAEFQNALIHRAGARRNLLVSCQNMAQCEVLVQEADDRRNHASGAYHLHNAFCLFCKAKPFSYA